MVTGWVAVIVVELLYWLLVVFAAWWVHEPVLRWGIVVAGLCIFVFRWGLWDWFSRRRPRRSLLTRIESNK
jgi:hypothetical protein